MIQSYRDKRTREFASGKRVKAFSGFENKAEMKLDQLDAATSVLDLNLPGNRLETLKGDRKGEYSMPKTCFAGQALRINDQWRICFEWPKDSSGPVNVQIVDYH
jgi:proteic killer suppression protein